MKKIFFFLAAIACCFAVQAGDDAAATRLHTMSNDYDAITGGTSDFTRPLGAVAVKFESPIENVAAYKGDKAILLKISKAEAVRVEALRRKLIEMYVRTYAGCKIDPNSQWQLIIACDPNTGLTDEKDQINDVPEEGVTFGRSKLTYPVVHGWYCLINKKAKTVVLDREVSGSGSAIDTALDDFSKKLVLDFADNIKEK